MKTKTHKFFKLVEHLTDAETVMLQREIERKKLTYQTVIDQLEVGEKSKHIKDILKVHHNGVYHYFLNEIAFLKTLTEIKMNTYSSKPITGHNERENLFRPILKKQFFNEVHCN